MPESPKEVIKRLEADPEQDFVSEDDYEIYLRYLLGKPLEEDAPTPPANREVR